MAHINPIEILIPEDVSDPTDKLIRHFNPSSKKEEQVSVEKYNSKEFPFPEAIRYLNTVFTAKPEKPEKKPAKKEPKKKSKAKKSKSKSKSKGDSDDEDESMEEPEEEDEQGEQDEKLANKGKEVRIFF